MSVLKARIGGTWQVIGGGGAGGAEEVFIGPDDPGATYDLWFDTDATTSPAVPAHNTTHETGGTDAITNLSGSVITSGTVADARLSTNVPLKNAANTFTVAPQKIESSASAQLILNSTAAPADGRQWDISNAGSQLYIRALLDSGGALSPRPLTLDRSGNVTVGANLTVNGTLGNVACKDQANTFTASQKISMATPILRLDDTSSSVDNRVWRIISATHFYFDAVPDNESTLTVRHVFNRNGDVQFQRDILEKNRTTPMGHWIDVPFNASNFAGGQGAWTVSAGNVPLNRYMLIGKSMCWALRMSGSSMAVSQSWLYLVPPVGIVNGGPGNTAVIDCISAGTTLTAVRIYSDPGSGYVVMSNEIGAISPGSFNCAFTAWFQVA
jgi:hypothetical protein